MFSNVTGAENGRGGALGGCGGKRGGFRARKHYEPTHPLRGSFGRLVGASLGNVVKWETDSDQPRGRPAGVAALIANRGMGASAPIKII